MKKIRELSSTAGSSAAWWCCFCPSSVLLVGDAIAFFDWRPLESTALALDLVVLLVSCLGNVWKLVRRAGASGAPTESMLQGIAGADGEAESSARSAQEIATLQAALQGSGRGAAQGALQAAAAGERQYLYRSCPGTCSSARPGSGKTTALLNSGLQLSARATRGPSQSMQGRRRHAQLRLVVHRRGGAARHRRPLHDAGQRARGRRRARGTGFLDLLKRFRPRQPLNGVIVTRERLRPAAPDRRGARALRARRARAACRSSTSASGVRFPVYVLVTKTDLLAGFSEIFGDMSTRGARAGLGHDASTARREAPRSTTPAQFGAEFERLERQAARARCSKRLHGERDLQRRARDLQLPAAVRRAAGRWSPNS